MRTVADMAERICSIEDCEKPTLCRGLCVTHYHRANQATKAERPAPGVCRGCGQQVPRRKPGPPPHYCGPDCRPRCDVEGCDKPRHGNVYCSAHHTRWKRYGDPLAPKVRQPNSGACAVEGCDKPSRKKGWCVAHWERWRRYGEPEGSARYDPQNPRIYAGRRPYVPGTSPRWIDQPFCELCGGLNRQTPFKSGRFCSQNCAVLYRRHGGIPVNPECARCGSLIDLSQPGKAGRRRRFDTKLCRKCKQMHKRHWPSVGQLARRDGPYCRICGCDVDMKASRPDPMRASVDHILPRALGGSDDIENCQLAHLRCNQVKSDRVTPDQYRHLLP